MAVESKGFTSQEKHYIRRALMLLSASCARRAKAEAQPEIARLYQADASATRSLSERQELQG